MKEPLFSASEGCEVGEPKALGYFLSSPALMITRRLTWGQSALTSLPKRFSPGTLSQSPWTPSSTIGCSIRSWWKIWRTNIKTIKIFHQATNNVEDYRHSTHLLGATTLRNVLGTKCLAEILSERWNTLISPSLINLTYFDKRKDCPVDGDIFRWCHGSLGCKGREGWNVNIVEWFLFYGNLSWNILSKDVRLPVQLQRAMAAEAEAAREARAKVKTRMFVCIPSRYIYFLATFEYVILDVYLNHVNWCLRCAN